MEQEIDETTLRLRLPSMTLTKNDIRELCKIVVKAANDTESSVVRLIISGNKEAVRTNSIDKLTSAKWPQEIDAASLEAFESQKFIRLLMSSHSMGANEAVISGRDSEWVTTRVKEIEDFISEHKNRHWVFFNVPLLCLISIVLGAMIGVGIALGLHLSFENGIFPGMIGFMASTVTMSQLHEVYPYILVEGGRSSTKSKLRKSLNWAIPSLLFAIVFNLIWQLVTQ